jgi:hypothetical protein
MTVLTGPGIGTGVGTSLRIVLTGPGTSITIVWIGLGSGKVSAVDGLPPNIAIGTSNDASPNATTRRFINIILR